MVPLYDSICTRTNVQGLTILDMISFDRVNAHRKRIRMTRCMLRVDSVFTADMST